MPPPPDARGTILRRLRPAAPWIVRASLGIVVALALGAPFALPPAQALWIAPLLLAAALGGWLGWHAYAQPDDVGNSGGARANVGTGIRRQTRRCHGGSRCGFARGTRETAQRASGIDAGQAGRGKRDDGQERIPGHDEPRDPHPAQRHHPAARHPALDPTRRGPARLSANCVQVGARIAAHRRRYPRLFQDRGEQARTRKRGPQPARVARRGASAAGEVRRGQGPDLQRRDRTRRAPRGTRRSHAPAPGAHQPGQQRDQIHRTRLGADPRQQARRDAHSLRGVVCGQGYGRRHRARMPRRNCSSRSRRPMPRPRASMAAPVSAWSSASASSI